MKLTHRVSVCISILILSLVLFSPSTSFILPSIDSNDRIDLLGRTPGLEDTGQTELPAETLANLESDTTFHGTRNSFSESEPNNEFTTSDDISSGTSPHTLSGDLTNRGDLDLFRIKLKGEGKPVDNLTVTLNSATSNDWGTEYYSTFYISIYGLFEKEFLLMKVVSVRVLDYVDCPPASIHAFDTDYYFIKVSSTCEYSWYNEPIQYSLEVTINQFTPPDNNQQLEAADKLYGKVQKQRVQTDTDLFDWWYVDTEDPENYETNFSFTLEITDSKKMNNEYISGQQIYFVTEVHVLIYHWATKGTERDEVRIANMNKKYDHENPIKFYYHYETSSQLRFYLGVYVQTTGKTANGDGEYIWGNGYCDGWVEYTITDINPKPMIAPVLTNAQVHEPIGKTYDTFMYTVDYSDENNDPPVRITIRIDNDGSSKPMVKLDETDNDFTDGCTYKFVIDGSEFDKESEEHRYRIYAEDVEREAVGNNSIHDKKLYGPIITENILPIPRPSGSKIYSIFEDDPISYLDLNTTFEDPDNDTLYYRLSNNNKDWSNIYHSENITIKVVTQETGEGTKKFLEFQPKPDMFNRLPSEDFGNEIVYINVSDDDPFNPSYPNNDGKISMAHYIWNPFELDLIIKGVNDPPQIKSSFSQYLPNGELELEEDNAKRGFDLYNIFWDPIENDPLTFSAIGNNNINVIFYKNGAVDFIPIENWTGIESFEIMANDGQATIYDTIRIKITPVNDNPYLNYTPKQTINEDEWFNITFIGYDEADDEPVYFETNLMNLLELSEDEYTFNTLTGELSFKPNNNNVNTYKDVEIIVRDHNGGSTTQYVVFEILNSPDAPIPEIVTPGLDDRFLVTELIKFRGKYYDPDNEIQFEEHSYEWYSSLDGFLSDELNFTTSLSEGEHTLTFRVIDPIINGTETINIRLVSESKNDLDRDGIPDYWEILHHFNDNNPYDADEDPDGDTYTNLEEYLGMDGSDGGSDDTNPWDKNEHPSKHFKKSSEEDDSLFYSLAIISIIIIIIIFLLIFSRIYRRKQKKTESDQSGAEEKRIMQDMYGRKYKEYKYEPHQIVCHNCLEKLEIQMPIRPLAVTCQKCGKRGVLYK